MVDMQGPPYFGGARFSYFWDRNVTRFSETALLFTSSDAMYTPEFWRYAERVWCFVSLWDCGDT